MMTYIPPQAERSYVDWSLTEIIFPIHYLKSVPKDSILIIFNGLGFDSYVHKLVLNVFSTILDQSLGDSFSGIKNHLKTFISYNL
jgi:hypothetical protein